MGGSHNFLQNNLCDVLTHDEGSEILSEKKVESMRELD